MSYDHDAQKQLNEDALRNPQPGDYWQEMFCPYFIVVAVNGAKLTVLSTLGGPKSFNRKEELDAKINNQDGTWSFDYSKSMIVDHAWIRNAVKYGSIDGFVADVSRSDRMKSIVSEWVKHRAQQLLQELDALGPEVTQYILEKDHA